MYTAAQLEHKTFSELKAIAREFGISPAADRRCRQSGIDALVNVNPPLQELQEVSPAAKVEQAQEPLDPSKFGRIVYSRLRKPIEIQATEAIVQAAENSPGVEVEQAQELIAQATENFPGVEVEQAQESIAQAIENPPGVGVDPVQLKGGLELSEISSCDCPVCGGRNSLCAVYYDKYFSFSWNIVCEKCWSNGHCQKFYNLPSVFWSDWSESTVDLQIGTTPLRTVSARLFNGRENSPGVEVDPLSLAAYRNGRKFPRCRSRFTPGVAYRNGRKFLRCQSRSSLARRSQRCAKIPPVSKSIHSRSRL